MKQESNKEICWLCQKEYHKVTDCPLWEDVKKITIARLKTMPDNMRLSIG